MYRTAVLLLQPTVGQGRDLSTLLAAQRELCNAALEERRGAWGWEGRSVRRLEQHAQLNGWDHPLLRFGVTPARGTLLRLDRAFVGFYRRARSGQKPGYPRFRSHRRWDSVDYPYACSWKVNGGGSSGRLYLQGVGYIRYRTSRRGVPGTPKTLVIRREGRRYRAHVACAVPRPDPAPPTGAAVGIDLGITALVATSDGELVDNERPLLRHQDLLGAAQRLACGRKRGSARRRKAAQQVAACHRRIARARRDSHHKLSRRLVDRYDLIVIEDLPIANLVRRPKPVPDGNGGFAPNGAAAKAGLNRAIHDAGWGSLIRMIDYKAAGAGRCVISVDPGIPARPVPAVGTGRRPTATG